jgi:short subunit dehydrogenase-like uncharacterized protein
MIPSEREGLTVTDATNMSIIERLLSFEVWVPLLLTLGVVTTAVVKAVAGTMTSLARERTRREIAAWIAEGAMTPEQGERIMKAGAMDRHSSV